MVATSREESTRRSTPATRVGGHMLAPIKSTNAAAAPGVDRRRRIL
jgi:hypothetical protein